MIGEVESGLNAQGPQSGSITPTDAPHILDGKEFERLDALFVTIDEATMTIANVTLGKMRSHLGQGLVGSKTNADRHAHALLDELVKVLTPLLEAHLFHIVEIDETFVYAIAEIGRRLITNDADHTTRQFSIKFIIAREDSYLLTRKLLGQLIIGHTCLDTQFLSFVTARNNTPIVVRKHNDGLVLQVGSEDSLTRNVAIIAVDDSVHGMSSDRF